MPPCLSIVCTAGVCLHASQGHGGMLWEESGACPGLVAARTWGDESCFGDEPEPGAGRRSRNNAFLVIPTRQGGLWVACVVCMGGFSQSRCLGEAVASCDMAHGSVLCVCSLGEPGPGCKRPAEVSKNVYIIPASSIPGLAAQASCCLSNHCKGWQTSTGLIKPE